MSKKLFLLDAFALIYRAHFALIQRPIFTSKGVNTSALYGFTQTLLQILNEQKPSHIAVVFDTDAPTQRHKDFADYKSQREAMPEDISAAIPHVRRMIDAFNITQLECDGCEADDIIGTLVKAAEKQGFTSYMVTPDKDFGQLVSEQSFLYKPSRMGDGIEIMGVKEILARWGIESTAQVTDILGLMGDASDNIPGVPGIGEKTASKLVAQFGSVENLLARTAELKGKLKDNLEANRDIALMSKKLATIHCDSPVELDIEKLKLRDRNNDAIKSLCVEFEFNTIGKRLFGDEFKAGRGFSASPETPSAKTAELDFSQPAEPVIAADLKSSKVIPHQYSVIPASETVSLFKKLKGQKRFAVALECSHPDPKQACITGLAFSLEPHKAVFIEVPANEATRAELLNQFAPLLGESGMEIIGHDLKRALGALRWSGVCVNATLFDTMLAHSLLEPDQRHSLQFLAESCLGYTPMPAAATGELNLQSPEQNRERAMEEADLALQLHAKLQPQLKEKQQEKVFYDIEAKLIPALVEMEFEGIRVDAKALADFGEELGHQILRQ